MYWIELKTELVIYRDEIEPKDDCTLEKKVYSSARR